MRDNGAQKTGCDLGPGLKATAGDLYDEYREWREENGEVPESKKSFGARLGRIPGLVPARDLRGRYWVVTGETRLHTCYDAEARGIALLLAGHYASERFALESLAALLAKQFPALAVWASEQESDPLRWSG